MRKAECIEPDVKTGRIEQACKRYSLGKNTMRKVADEAGAVIRVGKCYLVNYTKVDAYLDKLAGAEGGDEIDNAEDE